jgi:hypothetical protein
VKIIENYGNENMAMAKANRRKLMAKNMAKISSEENSQRGIEKCGEKLQANVAMTAKAKKLFEKYRRLNGVNIIEEMKQ